MKIYRGSTMFTPLKLEVPILPTAVGGGAPKLPVGSREAVPPRYADPGRIMLFLNIFIILIKYAIIFNNY